MSALTVHLPDELYEKTREIAASKSLSVDALIAIALTQTLSQMVRDPYMEMRAARATGKGLSEFLAQVPDAEPLDGDSLPTGYRRE